MDACQPVAPDAGYFTGGFELSGVPAATQPNAALAAVASHHGPEQSAMDPSGVTHFGPHSLASGAMFMTKVVTEEGSLGI